jgi:hypothetical protein
LAQVVALRAQVQELQALGVSLHKAADAGYRQGHADGCEDERASVVAWLRTIDAQYDYVGLTHLIDVIERGIPADALERQRLVDIPRACE